MQSSNVPSRFPVAFASSAGPAYVAPVPEASPGVPGRASLEDGFPPENFTPVGAGGTPPFGQDFNGLFRQITAGVQWAQAGGLGVYNATFQADIGGYPKGALVQSAVDPLKRFTSTAENNLTDPDAGGAGWRVGGQLLAVQVFTGSGTYTPTPGMQRCIIQAIGGGASGAASAVPSAGNVSMGTGGTSGTYAEGQFTAADIGASKAVTIGAGGVAAIGNGTDGGNTSVGALLVAPGGVGGTVFNNIGAQTTQNNNNLAPGPTGANILAIRGTCNRSGFSITGAFGLAPGGGDSPMGLGQGGAPGEVQNIGSPLQGQAARGYGSGGAGQALGPAAGVATAGGDGAAGFVRIYEFGG